MSDLLSDIDRATIRAAIQDVTDTFMKTPITYLLGGPDLDRFNEDKDGKIYTTYDVLGLAEYQQLDTDKMVEQPGGAQIEAQIKVTFNLDDLILAGLVNADTNEYIMDTASDKFIVNNVTYRNILTAYDGPLDAKNILVVIWGRVEAEVQ